MQVEFGVIAQTGFAFNRILQALSLIVMRFDNFRYRLPLSCTLNGGFLETNERPTILKRSYQSCTLLTRTRAFYPDEVVVLESVDVYLSAMSVSVTPTVFLEPLVALHPSKVSSVGTCF